MFYEVYLWDIYLELALLLFNSSSQTIIYSERLTFFPYIATILCIIYAMKQSSKPLLASEDGVSSHLVEGAVEHWQERRYLLVKANIEKKEGASQIGWNHGYTRPCNVFSLQGLFVCNEMVDFMSVV